MNLTVFGLASCDTCRAARRALEAARHRVAFRDLRAEPLTADEIAALLDRFGAGVLVNRRSTTWRGLDETARDEPPAALLAAHPALMKRPVILSDGGAAHVGWTANVRAALGL